MGIPPEDFSEQDVALVLNACARLGVPDEGLVTFFQTRVLPRVLPIFTSQGLANTTLALSRLPQGRGACAALTRSLATECLKRCDLHGDGGRSVVRGVPSVGGLQEP